MKIFKKLILLVLFISPSYTFSTEASLHLLIENDIDYAIAKDIQKITKETMNLTLYYDNYFNIVDKLLTDKQAQFGILPHDMMLYKAYIEKDKTFVNKIKMIIPLYDKHIYILVRKDENIEIIQDLRDKRVNVEKGQNPVCITGEIIQYIHHISWKESQYKTEVAIDKLLSKEIDAVIFTDVKPSSVLSRITKDNRLILLSPELNADYPVGYINSKDYSWLSKEVTTNLVSVILTSYNYQKSKTIQRFNTYTKNIKNVIDLVSLHINDLQKNGYYLWKEIEPYYYRKIAWPLHSISKNTIYTDMDRLDNFTNTIGMKFVTIAQGDFLMGSKDTGLPLDEQPQTKQQVDTFYMLTTEVTQRHWMQVMKANPSIFNTQKLKHHSDLNPVDNISFSDAQRFVDTLNSLEGRHNYRLPTEIEWEYASGDKEDNLSQSAWYKGNSPHHTSPVSLKKPNKWGLYDMLGNVWEWCNSPYTKEYNSTIA
ncbi:MAG: SUMF1/EgtB/PvdO family nonheme iron enzyme, partial [Sulfurovum sp.]|nr:SUMF1/EgtB/PvdO family nonheme iron enzyme [Sulfurovum sp.]